MFACDLQKSIPSSFHWDPSCIVHVTNDRVHCLWRWQCHIPIFANFVSWDGRLQWMLSLVIQMDECLVIKHDALKMHLKVWVILARYKNLLWYWLVGLFPALVLLCTHIFNISTTDFNFMSFHFIYFNAKLTAMKHVLFHNSQIISQTPINVKYARVIIKITPRRSCNCSNFQKGKRLPGMRCDILCSHTIALLGNDAFVQFTKLAKSGKWHCHLQWHYGNVLGHAWHTWFKKGPNGKRMSCSLRIMPHANIQINWL